DDEWIRDLKADVLNALFDRLEDPIPDRQTEILGVLRQLLPVYLARGDLVSATRILQELDVLLDRGDVLGAAQRALADGLFEELSEPVVLGQLLQALEDGG
ncbi:MAG: hypothetical protein GWN71_31385, partial [Gammaproteobacteria bacterium]|nr:hypothetical protein [Gemmatimonadota bacterium]NIU77895.1 hypothetical protein [Gammaproteobacteria bacterium]